MVIPIPVVEYLFGQIDCADQAREQLPRQGEIAAIDSAQQILAGHGHVFRIAGADVVVALVGAGTAFDARIEEYPQRTVFAEKFAELGNGHFLPVVDQFTGES